MIKAKVAHCHELSVQKNINCPESEDVVETLRAGDTIMIDTSKVYYNWKDRQYYKCDIGRDFDCFVATGGVEVV